MHTGCIDLKDDRTVILYCLFIRESFIFKLLLYESFRIVCLYLVKKDIPHLIVGTQVKNLPTGLVHFFQTSASRYKEAPPVFHLTMLYLRFLSS